MKKIIETQRAPGAIGPYVQGVDLGSMVFTSGQIPVCPHRPVRSRLMCKIRRV